MIRVHITEEQIRYTQDLIESCNFGNRGKFDGDMSKQLIGMLGQTVVADYLGEPRPQVSHGFDGGYDFVINGKKVDLKCMGRKRNIQADYVHNLIAYQKDYDVDYYLFASVNYVEQVVEICGVISKKDFYTYANYLREGAYRYCGRKRFQLQAPTYELAQGKLALLGGVYSERDIRRKIA